MGLGLQHALLRAYTWGNISMAMGTVQGYKLGAFDCWEVLAGFSTVVGGRLLRTRAGSLAPTVN